MGRSPARRPHQPPGAFYIMVDVSRSGLDGRTFALRLVEEEGVDRLCRTVVRMADINANTPVETRR